MVPSTLRFSFVSLCFIVSLSLLVAACFIVNLLQQVVVSSTIGFFMCFRVCRWKSFDPTESSYQIMFVSIVMPQISGSFFFCHCPNLSLQNSSVARASLSCAPKACHNNPSRAHSPCHVRGPEHCHPTSRPSRANSIAT